MMPKEEEEIENHSYDGTEREPTRDVLEGIRHRINFYLQRRSIESHLSEFKEAERTLDFDTGRP